MITGCTLNILLLKWCLTLTLDVMETHFSAEDDDEEEYCMNASLLLLAVNMIKIKCKMPQT